MSGFLRLFRAERIKWRRDWTLLAILLMPFTQVGFLLLIVWFSETQVTQFGAGFVVWYKINHIAWNLVFMPITVALVAALSWDLEERSRAWNHLLIQPVSCIFHYFAKVASHLSLLFAGQLLLALLLVAGGLILRACVPSLNMGPVRFSLMLRFAWFSLLASLPVISMHAWLSSRLPGLGLALALALGGSWFTFQLAGQGLYTSLLPWRLASHITDIALRAKLPDTFAYLGCIVSMLSFLAVGAFDFRHRTERRD